jgi:hypothetical protein
MKPERENNLVDLLDRLLNKGIILNADLIISVAGVPLIGINLKAALAIIETMLDYGMMEAWDESTREWCKKELTNKKLPLIEGETIFQKTFGYIWYSQGIIQSWRPGFWYLTNTRLFLWREEMLFETPLDRIEALAIRTEPYLNEERNVVVLQCCREVVLISVFDIAGFKDAIEKVSIKKLKFEIPDCELAVPLLGGK